MLEIGSYERKVIPVTNPSLSLEPHSFTFSLITCEMYTISALKQAPHITHIYLAYIPVKFFNSNSV